MTEKTTLPVQLAQDGFNEIRMCRTGPMIYNKFDMFIGRSLQKYGEFSAGEADLFRQIVRPGSLVVEVGANIGAHTVELSKLAGANGAVFAFEPQRIVFQTLCGNLALNQCANVYAQQAALGAENGTLFVPPVDPMSTANFGGVSMVGITQGEAVPVFTLDSLALPSCHILKVDVEGMEVEVLRGADRTIREHRPFLYLENDRHDSSPDLIAHVMNFSYDVYWHLPPLFNPDNFARDPENIFPNLLSVNIFCVPSEAQIQIDGMRRVTSPHDRWNI